MFTWNDSYTSDPSANSKLRKLELEKQDLIKCGLCSYHKWDNATRKARHSSWKNSRKKQYKA